MSIFFVSLLRDYELLEEEEMCWSKLKIFLYIFAINPL
jgi:hypothetical protein